jgi:hypothetical protein
MIHDFIQEDELSRLFHTTAGAATKVARAFQRVRIVEEFSFASESVGHSKITEEPQPDYLFTRINAYICVDVT